MGGVTSSDVLHLCPLYRYSGASGALLIMLMLRAQILILCVNFSIILIVFSYEFLFGFPGKVCFAFAVHVAKLSLQQSAGVVPLLLLQLPHHLRCFHCCVTMGIHLISLKLEL